jgi:hypothetical protein
MVKKLILKIAGILIIVAFINLPIRYFFYNKQLPYYWGNHFTLIKRNYLVDHKADFNTLFLGSSKTHYQVEPVLFDSLVNSSSPDSNKIHSYNFGIDGMMPPESFYLYKSILENDSLKFKTVILELNFLQTGETKNMFTWRGYYWLHRDTYHDYMSSMLNSQYPLIQKAWNFSLVNTMAVEKFYNMGMFNELVEFHREQFTDDTGKEAANHGFLALPRHKEFKPVERQKVIDVRKASLDATQNYDAWSKGKLNENFNNCIKDVIDISRKRGIRLIFLLPAEWNSYQYKEIFPILKTIPDRNKIVMYQYNEKFKPLFEFENMFDNSHVNGYGARIYTGFVAEAFEKIR